ncbi:MAG: Asp-tRNA(Asn)/Glu-tRNA(Gln) amidotransferase subunit GatA [Phycisphaerales bacterium]|nr:MAG: Asp-tRNA(Asn)/Glu-tRNA(Gln) amidotransferase subunit GatA [Phycisphaerales bacterium]
MGGIVDLADDIRSGRTSSEEAVTACMEHVDLHDRKLESFLSRDRTYAVKRARSIDEARARGDGLGLLAGVPLAVKDNLCTTFSRTTCGSKMLGRFESIYNAHVVQQLKSAGAVIVGKTNLDEFAMGSSTEHSAFAATRNPWNRLCVPGGSSGGSAAAVAARLVPGALGSDTGGSIRQPASFCGVVGLKPSYGRVSRYGLVAFASSLDQIGPITTDVRDAALLLQIIAGHDDRDSTSVNAAVPDYPAAIDRSLKGTRVGVAREYFGEGLNTEVADAVHAALDAMRRAGAVIVDIHLPHMKYAVACYYLIATAEASSNLARFDGVHYGHRTGSPADIVNLYAASRGEAFGAEVKRRIMLGTYALSAGYYEAYYLKALKVRTLIKRDFDAALQQVDVIASPVSPTTAFAIGERLEDPLAMYLADIYTISANLAGICAISVPCGFDSSGLPIGLQLMGPSFGEEKILAVAHQYQQLTDHHKRVPPDFE